MRVQSRDRTPLFAFLNAYTEGISGGDACFIEIARRLQEYDITVVTSALGAAVCREGGLQANFWLTTREARFTHTIQTYIFRTVKGLLLTRRVQTGALIYATSDFLPDVIPCFFCKICNRNVVWVQKIFHLIPPERAIPSYAQKLSHVLIRYIADLVIVDNMILYGELLRRGFPPDRLQVNYPGISVAEFSAVKPPPEPKYDAVYLGRLHPSKGIYDLIAIWQRVCRARPSATIGIIGRGDRLTREQLQQKIAAANLTANVVLLGFLERPVAINALRQSRVFVFPSREEGFGLAILEAIASGLPVVAWDLPVYREVFPAGVLRAPLGDHDAFAAAVIRLLGHPDERAQLVAEGRTLMSRYDWQKVAERESLLLRRVRISVRSR